MRDGRTLQAGRVTHRGTVVVLAHNSACERLAGAAAGTLWWQGARTLLNPITLMVHRAACHLAYVRKSKDGKSQ